MSAVQLNSQLRSGVDAKKADWKCSSWKGPQSFSRRLAVYGAVGCATSCTANYTHQHAESTVSLFAVSAGISR